MNCESPVNKGNPQKIKEEKCLSADKARLVY
jgi:hypothetical protein